MKIQLVTDAKIAETSSKGNQEKWFEAGENRWYKLDQFGYEALSETVISTLLEKSNIEKDFPFRFVRYQMERIKVHGHERTGCSSENFLKPGQSVITLSHLLRQENKQPLPEILKKLSSDKKRIEWIANQTVELTGLADFPKYLTLLFEIDALFLNDDRHLNNIAVLKQGNQFDYCPIFDNGAGLLSNTQIYAMDVEPKAHMKSLRARPFHTTFNRQIITSRDLFGSQLQIPQFSQRDILQVIEPASEYYSSRDRALIADRVCECILERQKAL